MPSSLSLSTPTLSTTSATTAAAAANVDDGDNASNNHNDNDVVTSSYPCSPLLARLFEMHQNNYHPSPLLTEDENYMDIVMIITRSSKLRQGSMGCLLVRPRITTSPNFIMQQQGRNPIPIAAMEEEEDEEEDDTEANNNSKNNEPNIPKDDQDDETSIEFRSGLMNRIIAATTNTSLFTPKESDVHAEINAIGQVARRRQTATTMSTTSSSLGSSNTTTTITTQGATAYITMPPCKKCFGALYASGISRIVSRRSHPMILHNVASKVGIQLVTLTQDQLDSQKVRLDQLFPQNARGVRDKDEDDGPNEIVVVEKKVGVDARSNKKSMKHANAVAEERERKMTKLDTAVLK